MAPSRALFIGLTTIDIQYFVDIFPQSNEKIKTTPPELLVGGPATNAAVAFAKLGGETFLASAVGVNGFKSVIEKDFKFTKIKHVDLVCKQEINAVMASVISSRINGDRTILTHNPGEITSDVQIDTIITDVNPGIVLLDGFYPKTALKASISALDYDVTIVMDCGSWKPQYYDLLKRADIAICSEDFYPPGCRNSSDVFTFLKSKGVNQAAISRGGKSILYYDEDKRGEIEVPQVKVIDTLGAGDFLHGAFCHFYLNENKYFYIALKKSAELASKTCEYPGTRSWLNYVI